MNIIIRKVREELKSLASEEIRLGAKRYFKEEIKVYGLKSADVAKLGKAHFKAIKGLPKAQIFAFCDELWRSGYMEESFIACAWAFSQRKQFSPDDFAIFERWVEQHVSSWASCDTLCNHTIGAFIEMYPDYIDELKRWAKAPNRWQRRAAAVSLIVPAKRGRFLPEVFSLADLLLTDPDDLVQKGYGWLLKVASQAHEDEVFRYVVVHKTIMPRTALRYAIEKMSPEHKQEAMRHG